MSEEPTIVRKLRKLGRQNVRLIVRTRDNPQHHTDEIQQLGLKVHQVFRLIKGVAVEGPASAAVELATRDWVARLDEDSEVQAQSGAEGGRP